MKGPINGILKAGPGRGPFLLKYITVSSVKLYHLSLDSQLTLIISHEDK